MLEFIVSAALPAGSLNKLVGKVDWIHFVGTGRDYIGFALVRLARRAGVHFTVWPAVHPRSWGDDVLDVRLYRKADTVMCQTAYEQRHLAELGVPDSKLLLCGLPAMCLADGNAESIRRELDLGNRLCALFLGRRDEGKGYFALLRAWPIVLQASPGCLPSSERARRPASGRVGQIAVAIPSGIWDSPVNGQKPTRSRPAIFSVFRPAMSHSASLTWKHGLMVSRSFVEQHLRAAN